MSEKKQSAYNQAVSTGQYVKRTGLEGKYDNVRRFWEDDVTRLFLRPYLKAIVDRKARKLRRLRILDIGCGAGDGYDLLTGITAKDVGIYEYAVKLLDQEMLGYYKGIDINEELLSQAREHLGNTEKIRFEKGDVSKGLRVDDDPFDVYFSSYGTFSHFNTEQTVNLVADIARHAKDRAIVVLDWIGRYSYEWQDLWSDDIKNEQFMDYMISYIYSPEERETADIETFPLRLIYSEEATNMIEEASRQARVQINIKQFFDRSVFVGRHMDTGDYNKNCPAIRKVVNSLLEPNQRTDLNELFIDYMPRKGFQVMNSFFEMFSMSWNALVRHTVEFLQEYHESDRHHVEEKGADSYEYYPEPLKVAVDTMRRVINTTGDLPGDTRANIVEPQLAYALRKLEMELQSGIGSGHGLVGILEIVKE